VTVGYGTQVAGAAAGVHHVSTGMVADVKDLAGLLRRIAVTVAGTVILAVGVVLLVAPGPGLVVIALALAVFATGRFRRLWPSSEPVQQPTLRWSVDRQRAARTRAVRPEGKHVVQVRLDHLHHTDNDSPIKGLVELRGTQEVPGVNHQVNETEPHVGSGGNISVRTHNELLERCRSERLCLSTS